MCMILFKVRYSHQFCNSDDASGTTTMMKWLRRCQKLMPLGIQRTLKLVQRLHTSVFTLTTIAGCRTRVCKYVQIESVIFWLVSAALGHINGSPLCMKDWINH